MSWVITSEEIDEEDVEDQIEALSSKIDERFNELKDFTEQKLEESMVLLAEKAGFVEKDDKAPAIKKVNSSIKNQSTLGGASHRLQARKKKQLKTIKEDSDEEDMTAKDVTKKMLGGINSLLKKKKK